MPLSEYFRGPKREYTKAEIRRARIVAVFLSVYSFISIIAIVFALIYKAREEAVREDLQVVQEKFTQSQKIAEANALEASRQHKISTELIRELQECKQGNR